MDDLLLFTPSKKSHIVQYNDLLKGLLKNGLKISPKKCQLFRTELKHIGNTILIQDRRVCVKPLRSRLETKQKLQQSTTVKGCRSFAGKVNFLNMFCPKLPEITKDYICLNKKR